MDTIVKAAAARRQALAAQLGDGIAVLTAAPPAPRSRDTFYAPYRQDSYFYYLTACEEPQSALILTAAAGKLQDEYFLCRPYDPHEHRWDGERLTPTSAKRRFGFGNTAALTRLPTLLAELAQPYETLFYLPAHEDQTLEAILKRLLRARRAGNRQAMRFPTRLVDISSLLDDMRVIKDEDEIELMRQACRLTADGVMAAMRVAPSARRECEIEAELIATYRRGGGAHAFAPIVASGKNACILHYTRNNARVQRSKGLLIDSGCELNGYAGDITRAFPANGRWQGGFAAVYEVVLAAQLAALRAAKPGATLAALEKAALRQLVDGLRDLKLCRGSRDAIIDKKSYRRFYMHGIGHWLGLDVHDVGAVQQPGDARSARSRRLQPGMVLTVEPGLYIGADNDILPALRNIGVRIEDDILITRRGHEVLTAAAVKKPQEISAWMGAG